MHTGDPQDFFEIDSFAVGQMHEIGEEVLRRAGCPFGIAVVRQRVLGP
jgi:hypothetical protein